MTSLPFEILNPKLRRGSFRAVIFDFDGTLSLLREGWPRVMVGMMMEHLHSMSLVAGNADEDARSIHRLVMARNGEPTIRQMEAFAEEVRRRGGTPLETISYLQDYLDRLMRDVRTRWNALESGAAHPRDWVVPGAHAQLQQLRERGVPLFVASGTEHEHVVREARLLEVESFFPTGINAPKANDRAFGKGKVIDWVLSSLGIRGEELLGFGDGTVETREVKRVGGVAVAVASSEQGSRLGTVNLEKREELIAAGADLVVADYSAQEVLIPWLWGERN